jgi:hypothetical protein
VRLYAGALTASPLVVLRRQTVSASISPVERGARVDADVRNDSDEPTTTTRRVARVTAV